MKTELIKEFEQKYERSRFLSDSGIGDMYSEQGCYCDKYVEFLEQKLANGAEQSKSNCNIPYVNNSVCPDCKGTGYIDHPELGHRVSEVCHCNK